MHEIRLVLHGLGVNPGNRNNRLNVKMKTHSDVTSRNNVKMNQTTLCFKGILIGQ